VKRKYFLFRKEDLSLLSSSSSDDGEGLSVFGVSADSMSYITAIQGGVVMYFNNATPFEDNQLTDGESFEKTKVVVNCEEGKEVALIESVMNFLSSESSPAIMRFDSVDQNSSLKEVRTSVSVGASIKNHPINRVTKEVSFQLDNGFTAATGNVINDINFLAPENKPEIDYEFEEGTYNASAPFNLTAMANAGTLGSAYDIDIASSVGGNYTKADGSSSNGLSKTSVQFGLDSFLKIGNTYTASDEYTLYTVISFNAAYGSPIKPLYGSDSGETVGLSIVDSTSATPMKYQPRVNTIGVRHENKLSTPAAAGTNNTSQNTIDYRFPVTDSDQDDYQKIYILLIRRNSNGDIIAYNYLGERIAFIQGTDKTDPSSKLGTLPGDTNGDLVIDQIGSAGSNVDDSFKGRVARFGVINRDVGDEVTRNLAKQLFNLYKF
jgi:hypothetical protein